MTANPHEVQAARQTLTVAELADHFCQAYGTVDSRRQFDVGKMSTLE